MPVKFIETKPQQQQAQSSTGVRLVKNVGPNRGPMVLYKVPKKISFNRLKKKVSNAIAGVSDKINNSIEDAFTNNIEVWVARCYFSKKYGSMSQQIGTTLKSQYVFGCVKLTRDTFWAFKNLTNEEPGADFVDIDTFYTLEENGSAKDRNRNIQTRTGRVYYLGESDIGKYLPDAPTNQPYDYNTNRSFDLPNETLSRHIFDLFKYYSTISFRNTR
jgi:hypothetical protein